MSNGPKKQRLRLTVENSVCEPIVRELEERSAELEHEKFETEVVLHSLGEAMYVVDKDYIVRMMNPYGAELLGYSSPDEIVGKKLDEAVPAVDNNGEVIALEKRSNVRALKADPQDRIWSASAYFIKKDGNKIPVQVTTTAISIDEERMGAITVFRDMTRDKKIEEAKTEFIFLAAHQLRTPISVILLNLELLQRECDAVFGKLGKVNQVSEMKRTLEDINGAAKSVSGLIDTLLNISRIEMGTMSIEKEGIDLQEMIEKEAALLESVAREKDETITITLDPELPKIINSDRRLLQIILQNLISNAIKYGRKGGQVSIVAKKVKGMVRISITDDGIGIPHSDQTQVFRKFFRAENISNIQEKGVGLGLHLVRSAVEELSGAVWFESNPERGSTFFFEIAC